MQHTLHSQVRCLVLAALLSAALVVPVVVAGQEQELKTLKLVRTYQSEADVRAAYPEMSSKNVIRDEGDSINFYEPGTGKLLKQLNKEQSKILREEQHDQRAYDIKKTYTFHISPHQSLVMYTEYEGQYLKGTEMSEAGPQPQRRILYNHAGEVITELPPHLNIIQDSPDHNYFVAAHSGEIGADFLYFYDIQGNLLKKQEMNQHIGFEYSPDSEYVKVRKSNPASGFGEVFVFTKRGDLITTYDYGIELHKSLGAFYVSDNAQLLLFSMFNAAYLIAKDGSILWEKPYLRIIDCRFNVEKHYLLFYAPLDRGTLVESRKAVYVASLTNGELLDSIEDVELLQITPHGFWIKKEGIYYEYSVQ